jgi:hypothetical protein
VGGTAKPASLRLVDLVFQGTAEIRLCYNSSTIVLIKKLPTVNHHLGNGRTDADGRHVDYNISILKNFQAVCNVQAAFLWRNNRNWLSGNVKKIMKKLILPLTT